MLSHPTNVNEPLSHHDHPFTSQETVYQSVHNHHPPRSSSPSPIQKQAPNRKRPRSSDSHLEKEEEEEAEKKEEESSHTPLKKPRISRESPERIEETTQDPVAYWAEHLKWPTRWPSAYAMAEPSKRKSSSPHRSVYLRRLRENGILMDKSLLVSNDNLTLCRELREGNREPTNYMPFPSDKFLEVLSRVLHLNEARLQKDILPWVVPSAETLRFCGELNLAYLGEEYNALWDRCPPMGGTLPKPDYVVGIAPEAFTEDQRDKLNHYSSPEFPYLVTPELCFPFLVCEVKTGEKGTHEADRQNVHSASIAVRAIIKLFTAAFGQSDVARRDKLYGEILVFSVSHIGDVVYLYGHYATPSEKAPDLQFHRYPIDMVHLSLHGGEYRHKSYNFIRNVYDDFAPKHWKRITDAVSALPSPGEQTRSSIAYTGVVTQSAGSQQGSQVAPTSQEGVFKRPSKPASAMEIERLNEQNHLLLQQQRLAEQRMQEQRKQMEEQMQKQEKQMQEREKQMEEQMQEQRKLIDRLTQRLGD